MIGRIAASRRLLAVVALAGGLAFSSCATEQTWEEETGRTGAEEIAQTFGLVEGELAEYVSAIGALLVERGHPEGGPYRFHVVDRVEPNAFALPGGYVYVSRGMLALLDDESELAGVLAHEIGHVAARHHVRALRRSVPFLPLRIATAISSAAVGLVSGRLAALVGAIGDAPGGLLLSAYSRQQERDADRIGQQIAAASGWDPDGIPRVMRTLARDQALHGEDPDRLDFFATHPNSPERERETTERARSLPRSELAGLAQSRKDFLGRLDGLLVGPSGAAGVFVDSRFLHRDLDFTITFPVDWQLENGPHAVAGGDEAGDVGAFLSLEPGQSDALEAARTLPGELGATVERGPERVEVNGLRASRVEALVDGTRALLYWVEHGERLFRIVALAAADEFESRRSALEAVALSFRPLRSSERNEVKEARLRLFEGARGERVRKVVERVDTTWSPEQAAVANGLEVDVPLEAARLLKLPVLETYEGRGPAR